MDKKTLANNTLTTIKVLVGAFLMSLSIHTFTIPAKFFPGGVSGIASMVQILTNFEASYTVLIINLPLIVVAFFVVNKTFALKSLVGTLLMAGMLRLWSFVDFYTYVNPSQPLLSAIAGGIISGAGVGLLVGSDFCPGGTEIAGVILQKKHNSISISYIILAINCIVVILGCVLYKFAGKMATTEIITIAVCSLVQIFFNSKSMDLVLNGGRQAVKFEVVTEKTQELTQAILSEIGRSVTIMNSYGGYSQSTNNVLICVISRSQISSFKRLLKRIDPQAFAFAINTREVLGRGFKKVK
ncbi:MAG: YitT family protein [Christensenellales bacterium]